MKYSVSLWENYLHRRAIQLGLTSSQREIYFLIFEQPKRQENSYLFWSELKAKRKKILIKRVRVLKIIGKELKEEPP
jgi:hypothetical protein